MISPRPCAGSRRYAVAFVWRAGQGTGTCPVCARVFASRDMLGPDSNVLPEHSAPTCGVGQLLSDIGGM